MFSPGACCWRPSLGCWQSLHAPSCTYGSGLVLTRAGHLQDVYRSLVGPRAFRGLLRIRTSPEIRITKGYSPLAPVPEAQHLWQLPSCGQHAAVGFDFEYASSAGFSRSKTGRAVLQMAFQYSVFQPAGEASDGGAAASPQQVHGYAPSRLLSLPAIRCLFWYIL